MCSQCPETIQKQRKCRETGLNNLAKGRKIDSYSIAVPFCAAKATWYECAVDLFYDLLVAKETGVLPKPGSLEDQSDDFCACFGFFVDHYKTREYYKVWRDVGDFTPMVLEAFAKMFSKIFGGK